jgi:hypothetical protein
MQFNGNLSKLFLFMKEILADDSMVIENQKKRDISYERIRGSRFSYCFID